MISKTGAALILGQIVLFRSGGLILGGKLHGVLDDEATVRIHDGDIFQHIKSEDIVPALDAFMAIDEVAVLKKQFANCQARLDDAINASILRDGGVNNSRTENNPEFPGLGAPEIAPETPLNDPAAAETGEAGAEVTQPSAPLVDAVPTDPATTV